MVRLQISRFLRTRVGRAVGRSLGRYLDLVDEALNHCRCEYTKGRLGSCGEGVELYPGVSVVNPEKVCIGRYTHVGSNAHIRGGGTVHIGEYCQVANNVIISSASFP